MMVIMRASEVPADLLRFFEPVIRTAADVWKIPTEAYPAAHFATYPRRLVEPCIKAGTSAKGCCPECGCPWVRVVEKNRKATRPARNNCRDESGMANRDYERHVTESRTLGWRPGCDCGCTAKYEPIPCTVLDPFMGSGTTLLVAAQLGRDSIGIELSPEYVKLAEDRIGKGLRPSTYRPDVEADAPLFRKEAT